ncbi:hypothetical protein ILFOPFJJ_01490 [Ensifer psoraleae]|uniref:DUF3168 domain-containing protein n=1 Tax=Sinorhizobium psoraleae TaxID=520838 RepID=UPI00156894DE|nr:DUF3168 domain-containing protein [Sinorhizobium psoraleae]NRP70609.1 hypothetical protein [Sinorhizobium psoraleae]
MSSAAELQKLYYDTLKADSAIMALAYGVYDRVPEKPFGPVDAAGNTEKTAYIVLGETDDVEDDAECITGLEKNTTIHVWSRAVGKVECKRLVDLVRKALHRRPLALTENALVDIWVDTTRVFSDPDGLSTHGVVQVRAVVEEP